MTYNEKIITKKVTQPVRQFGPKLYKYVKASCVTHFIIGGPIDLQH
jgi:hypothetical protein